MLKKEQMKKPSLNLSLALFFIVLIAIFLAMPKANPNIGITGQVIIESEPEIINDPTIVLSLTFDDESDPWEDSSSFNHNISTHGEVSWSDRTNCKWYGCVDLTSDGNDYLSTEAQFSLNEGFAVSFWIKYTNSPTGGNPQIHIDKGYNTPNYASIGESSWGMEFFVSAEDGLAFEKYEPDAASLEDTWTHYFLQYNGESIQLWKDGILIKNSPNELGNINHSIGEVIRIGYGKYGQNTQGYIDELYIWNRTNFTTQEVQQLYNFTKLGTPPNKDLYIKAIKYDLPIDWDDEYNRLDATGSMDIIITIANAGIYDSGTFDYRFELDDNLICEGSLSVSAQSEETITCPWSKEYGFHIGEIRIDADNDVNEDIEINNIQTVYIPFLDRPWFHFTLDEWDNIIEPYSSNPENLIVYNSYTWVNNFDCSAFNEAYTGNNIDPYGKKARECAMGCFVRDYDQGSKNMCDKAYDHLFGWANRTISSYNYVQALHELSHLGMAYDLMFPNLNEDDHERLAKQLHDICLQITNMEDTRPYNDDDSIILGDNGLGFGSGMGAFCYSILGSYPENPSLINQREQQYWGENIADEWMDREIRYLRSLKNDPWAHYQERISYKWYSQYHLVENFWFETKNGFDFLDDYSDVMCSMAREVVTDVLDFNYNGATLRNDESHYLRTISTGDSDSYENIGSGSFISYDILTFYGIFCNDINIKKSILWLKDKAYSTGDSGSKYISVYLYKLLDEQAGSRIDSVDQVMPDKVIFDNANDILTIRTNYTYVNDNVIQIDGGEEGAMGHSQAQGYFLYALGEPFLDYEQVPYEDDVRAETWKNGISLQNAAQTEEGTAGTYSSSCGNAPLNQYYGMKNCPNAIYPDDYPNFRRFPLEYGGDLEDYIGTKDANFAGVYVWRPYKNADPVEEYFVKFGDLLAKRTVVSSVTEGDGIYHNFIDIYNEFTETRDGTDFTLSRNGKNLEVKLLHPTTAFTLNGGDSGVRYCFCKTSCSSSCGGNGNYRRLYLHTDATATDFILAHHWYYDGEKVEVTGVQDTDKGLNQADNYIIYDTSNNGVTSYGSRSTDGWALAFNDEEIASFDTTYIIEDSITVFESDRPISAHIKRLPQKTVLTVNTMERDPYIDVAKTAEVTVYIPWSSFIITKDGQPVAFTKAGNEVTFSVTSGQNSDEYVIESTGTDTTAPIITNITYAQSGSSVLVTVKTNEHALLTIGSYSSEQYKITSTITIPDLSPGNYTYTANVCDVSSNCRSEDFGIIVAENSTENISAPIRNSFGGLTSNMDDYENVIDPILEIVGYGRIEFTGTFDLTGANLDNTVKIGKNSVSVTLPALNASAIITLYNINYSSPKILRNGQLCEDCVILDYVNTNISFSVPHFTNYSVVSNSSLFVWNSGQTVFANYSNQGPITNALCTVRGETMNYADSLYSYTFNYGAGTYPYTVECSADGEDTLQASGSFSVQGENEPTVSPSNDQSNPSPGISPEFVGPLRPEDIPIVPNRSMDFVGPPTREEFEMYYLPNITEDMSYAEAHTESFFARTRGLFFVLIGVTMLVGLSLWGNWKRN